jgi:hypothetical protein
MLTFELSPPRVGEIVLCPSCRIDAPPRQVVKAEINEHFVLAGRETACRRYHDPGASAGRTPVSDDIRPEILGRAAADVADVELRAMGEKDAILAELTDAEKEVLARGSGLIAVNKLRDVGMLKDPPTALDATTRQLRAIAAAWGILSRWDSSLDMDRKLGDQLKVIPVEDAELIVAFLRMAGLTS